jgi:hypothetical protein
MDAIPFLLLALFGQLASPPAPRRVLSEAPARDVRTVSVAANGSAVAAATSERLVLQWELGAAKAPPTIKLAGSISEIAYAPNGESLATLSNSLEFWDRRTSKRANALPDVSAVQLAFALDGAVAVGGYRVRLLQPGTLKVRAELPEQAGWLNTCIAYSADGALVAAGDVAGNVWVWDAASRSQRLRRKGHVNRVNGVGFIDDGRTLVSGGADGQMKFWDLKTGRETGAVFPHESSGLGRGIGALVCSPDGKTIATGGADDGTVKLWEVTSGKLRATLHLPGVGITSLSIALGGSTLAAGGKRNGAGIVAAWRLYASAPSLTHPVRPALWHDLHGDAASAYQAMLALASQSHAAVAILNQRLRPVVLNAAVRKECDALIGSLDSENFDVRDNAYHKLEAMSPWIESHLAKSLSGAKTLELQRRLQSLIARVGQSTLPMLRAVEVLEHAPSSEARALLWQMAAGEPQARITRAAKQSLHRLERLNAPP